MTSAETFGTITELIARAINTELRKICYNENFSKKVKKVVDKIW